MSDPIVYRDGKADGPATDADIQDVLPPELLALWQAGAFDDDE